MKKRMSGSFDLDYLVENLGYVDQFGRVTELGWWELELVSEMDSLERVSDQVHIFHGCRCLRFRSDIYVKQDWTLLEVRKELEATSKEILCELRKRHLVAYATTKPSTGRN